MNIATLKIELSKLTIIWEYYNLLIYDTQVIFADEKSVNMVNLSSLKYSYAKISKIKYLSAKI